MSEGNLHDHVEEFRTKIKDMDLPAEIRERMAELITQLERKLESPDDQEHHESLVAQLKDSFERFKLEHPRATSLLNSILVSLGEAGI